MNNFWSTLGISVTGSVLLSGILVWLCREWISARLRKSIQHEYDVKLEGFKAGYQKFLAENEIRFSWWHEEKAKAIKEIYNDLAAVHYDLTFLLALENDPNWQVDLVLKANVREQIGARYTNSIDLRHQKWMRLRLFIEDSEDNVMKEFALKTAQIQNIYYHCILTNNIPVLQKDGPTVLKELESIMEKLRHRFQDILQGKDSEK